MRYFASFGLGFVRKLLIRWHMAAFISRPAAAPQARLTVERRGLTGAGSAVTSAFTFWLVSSSIHFKTEMGHHTTLGLVNIRCPTI